MGAKVVEMVKGLVGTPVTAAKAEAAAKYMQRTLRVGSVGECRAIVFRALTGRLPLAVRMTRGELMASVDWYLAGLQVEAAPKCACGAPIDPKLGVCIRDGHAV